MLQFITSVWCLCTSSFSITFLNKVNKMFTFQINRSKISIRKSKIRRDQKSRILTALLSSRASLCRSAQSSSRLCLPSRSESWPTSRSKKACAAACENVWGQGERANEQGRETGKKFCSSQLTDTHPVPKREKGEQWLSVPLLIRSCLA